MSDLRERLGSQKLKEIKDLVFSGDLQSSVSMLLTDYYDLLYSKHLQAAAPFQLEVNGDNPALAAEQIIQWSQGLAKQEATRN